MGGGYAETAGNVPSGALSGTPLALFPEQDFAWFPLENVVVVTVPLGFSFGWVVSLLDRPANRGKRRI
ncbi:hypothetical protein [Streptomyces rhizosphaerihabitans]|uniref:hypothetical protein n=1 Tax=Streptomyces rhizosphaerihabitans TaxID=1266770 RepID=UPI0021BE71E5|nr:hypothetical protein [Streptomyces rhizosphaerihabitans]MCT9007534.1 hypothetical protein [Streptomyces rhizosphaerihabitans]